MKKLFLLLIPLFIWSCSNDDYQVAEKVFEFNSIRWIKEAGDGEEFLTITIPEQIVENTGTTIMPVTISTEDYVKDTSVFESDDPLAFILDWNGNKPLMIDVPSFDSNPSGYFYPRGSQVPYEEGETILTPKRKITETTELPSNTRIRYNDTATVQKLTFTYEIVLLETTTKEEKIIKGKWCGSFYYSGTSEAVIEEINAD